MKKKKEILYYLPFALLLLAEWIIHWKIDLNVVGGDDTVFLAYSQEEGFSLIPWLAERYMTWSSRTAIEAVLMLMVNLPAVVWRIADSFVVVIGAAALTRLLERREYREYYSFFVSLVMLALPYTLMSTAGWIATSVNYMWPLAAGLIGLYPIRKYIDGRPVNVLEAVLYTICLFFAGNSEQMAFVLLASYGCYGLYLLWNGKGPVILRKYRYVLFQFVLAGLCFVNILLCPGNKSRSVLETERFLPEFADYSVFKKLELGVAAAIKSIFVEENTAFLVLTFLLAVLIWQYKGNWIYRMLSLVPVSVTMLFVYVRRILGSDHPFLNLSTLDGVCLIGVCGLVLPCFFFLFGREWRFLLISMIFLAALATKVVMGFSPTIHASGLRTSWVMDVMFIACVTVLLSKWDFEDEKANLLLCALTICLCAGGIFLNYISCTQIAVIG